MPYPFLMVTLKYVHLVSKFNCRCFLLLRDTLWVLLLWLEVGKYRGGGCAVSSSSQHPDLLISTGAAVPVSSCAYAVTAHRRLFTYAASKALVRKQERRGVERFSVWKGIHFPLHLITLVNTTGAAHRLCALTNAADVVLSYSKQTVVIWLWGFILCFSFSLSTFSSLEFFFFCFLLVLIF